MQTCDHRRKKTTQLSNLNYTHQVKARQGTVSLYWTGWISNWGFNLSLGPKFSCKGAPVVVHVGCCMFEQTLKRRQRWKHWNPHQEFWSRVKVNEKEKEKGSVIAEEVESRECQELSFPPKSHWDALFPEESHCDSFKERWEGRAMETQWQARRCLVLAAVSWASSSHDGSAKFKLSISLYQGQANVQGNRSHHPLRGAWCQAHICFNICRSLNWHC